MNTFTMQYNDVYAKLYNCDNIDGMYKLLEPDSIDLVVTSIPFGSLFTYSGRAEDIGNNADGLDLAADQFGLHMRFHLESLFRVMKPGCNVCIHIQQLLRYKNEHGYIGRRDFRGALIDLMEATGFEWKGEVAIEKNPQIIAQRLKLHSLMFVTGKNNARDLAPAVNDYLMIFQKPGEAVPVEAIAYDENPDGEMTSAEWIAWARGVWRNSPFFVPGHGNVDGLLAQAKTEGDLEGYDDAMKYMLEHDWLANGIWHDISEVDVLENFKSARDDKDEKHVCPLQLEVIRRCIKLYSNKGETVLDPFNGIGSTSHVALEQGRNAIGFELKDTYFDLSCRNMKKLADKAKQLDLLG